jgi:dimethylaniline monooxygenase (N-oxide forming)
MEQLGLGRPHPDLKSPHLKTKYRWDYASLANPPDVPGKMSWSASIYRGLVPAKNILNRDFAVNGAMVCPNFFTASLAQETRKTNNQRLPFTIVDAPKF